LIDEQVTPITFSVMEILSALFIEGIDTRQVAGPSTRIDITGVQFSAVAPNPVPATIEPHLCVIVHCPPGSRDTGALEVTYMRGEEQIARMVEDPWRYGWENPAWARADAAFAELRAVFPKGVTELLILGGNRVVRIIRCVVTHCNALRNQLNIDRCGHSLVCTAGLGFFNRNSLYS
jgi:hypothetical protein